MDHEGGTEGTGSVLVVFATRTRTTRLSRRFWQSRGCLRHDEWTTRSTIDVIVNLPDSGLLWSRSSSVLVLVARAHADLETNEKWGQIRIEAPAGRTPIRIPIKTFYNVRRRLRTRPRDIHGRVHDATKSSRVISCNRFCFNTRTTMQTGTLVCGFWLIRIRLYASFFVSWQVIDRKCIFFVDQTFAEYDEIKNNRAKLLERSWKVLIIQFLIIFIIVVISTSYKDSLK